MLLWGYEIFQLTMIMREHIETFFFKNVCQLCIIQTVLAVSMNYKKQGPVNKQCIGVA